MTAATLQEAYARSERIVGRRIAGEYLLVPLVGRGADIDGLYNLNRVAAFVWEHLDGRTRGTAIVDALVAHFDVEPARAEADYLGLIEQLLSIDAVRAPEL